MVSRKQKGEIMEKIILKTAEDFNNARKENKKVFRTL